MRLLATPAVSLHYLLALTAIAISAAGVAHSQSLSSMPNANNNNRDIQRRQLVEQVNDQHSRDQAQVAKFMEAIKSRKDLYPDFDKVVLHGNAPVTSSMLALMSESPYAADIAYYLGQHQEQSGAIAKMPQQQARSAIKQIEAAAAATNPIRN